MFWPVYPGILDEITCLESIKMTLKRFVTARGNRRDFLEKSARNAAGVAAGVAGMTHAVSVARSLSANETLNIAIIGLRSRGKKLGEIFASLPNCRVVSICDVDGAMFAPASTAIETHQNKPAWVRDFRRVLDDKSVDAVVIATPDHWHGLMTVMACEAGKDVYVEKPMAHNIDEERRIVVAANQYQRVVQVGLQQRTSSHFQSAIEFIRSGRLGTVRLAKAWTSHQRKRMSATGDSRIPQGVNYDMWLGPAPKRAFNANRFHHSWRWFWDYGTGELGNWGIHMLDVARQGLGVELPQRVSVSGGSLYFTDQETPDTLTVGYDFGAETIVWEHRQWSHRGIEGRSAATAFYGDNGTLIVDRSGWKVYETGTNESESGTDSTTEHCRDFVNAVRSRSQPTGDVESARISGALCHLGNIATRAKTDLLIHSDDANLGLQNDAVAMLGRSHRERWSFSV